MTITGTSFFDVNSVSFNGANASFTVRCRSAQEIVAVVPATATTGPNPGDHAGRNGCEHNTFLVTSTSDLAVGKAVSTSFDTPPQTLTYSIRGYKSRALDSDRRDAQRYVTTGATFIVANSPRGTCSVTNGIVTAILES